MAGRKSDFTLPTNTLDAADAEITDVWVWYEPVSAGSYLIYIGYA